MTRAHADAGPGLEVVDVSGRGGNGRPRAGEAEVGLVGAAISGGDYAVEAATALDDPDLIVDDRLRATYRAARRVADRGDVPDLPLTLQALQDAGEVEEAGGRAAVLELFSSGISAAHAPAYAREIREAAARRRLGEAVRGARLDVNEHGSVREAVAAVRAKLDAVEAAAAVDRDDPPTAQEILDDPDARRTPVTVADRLAWGGLVTLIAGREKSGKSTLIRWAVARRTRGEPVWGGPPTRDAVRVLYWGQERPVDVAADLDRFGADLDGVYVRDMRMHVGDRFGLLRHDLEAVEPCWVMVDTLSTFTDCMDLDPGSAADWEPVMNRFGALAQETGAAIGLNHHARKSDGQYRDSTAIGAGVDCILEMRRDPAEGETVRAVDARARSAVPAADFRYHMAGTEADPQLSLLDGSLSLDERVQRFVAEHEGCSQNDVRKGVHGRDSKIRDALKELSEDGGPLVCDDSGTPYTYRTRKNPRGTGPEQGRNSSGTGSTDSGGRSCSGGGLSPVRGSPPEQQAGSVDHSIGRKDNQGGTNTCPSCDRRIGPTSTLCATCQKEKADE